MPLISRFSMQKGFCLNTYAVKGAECDFCVRVVTHPCVEGHVPCYVLRKKP